MQCLDEEGIVCMPRITLICTETEKQFCVARQWAQERTTGSHQIHVLLGSSDLDGLVTLAMQLLRKVNAPLTPMADRPFTVPEQDSESSADNSSTGGSEHGGSTSPTTSRSTSKGGSVEEEVSEASEKELSTEVTFGLAVLKSLREIEDRWTTRPEEWKKPRCLQPQRLSQSSKVPTGRLAYNIVPVLRAC